MSTLGVADKTSIFGLAEQRLPSDLPNTSTFGFGPRIVEFPLVVATSTADRTSNPCATSLIGQAATPVDDWNDCEHWIAQACCSGVRSRGFLQGGYPALQLAWRQAVNFRWCTVALAPTQEQKLPYALFAIHQDLKRHSKSMIWP
ncbi:hypothetical protein PMIN07_011325 [Paraphaeosphaeria minitans]